MLAHIPKPFFFFVFSLNFLCSLSAAQDTEAPATAPPVTMAPVTAAPVDTTPSVSPSEYPLKSDFRCGTNVADAMDNCGKICQFPTDCPQGTFCFGSWNKCYTEEENSIQPAPATPLPRQLQAISDRRCGVTEADSRSNCNSICTNNLDCDTDAGEACWITHISYCHIMPENHPKCNYEEVENVERRCGYDEMAARGFCGAACEREGDCLLGEKCFPVHLNLCECFEAEDIFNAVTPPTQNRNLEQNSPLRQLQKTDLTIQDTNRVYFERAKEPLNKYFQADDGSSSSEDDGSSSSGDGGSSSSRNNHSASLGFLFSNLLVALPFLL